MRISDVNERHFYEIEAAKNDWSLSELKRQFNSALYERLVLSTNKEKVSRLATEGQIIEKPKDAVKIRMYWSFLGFRSYRNIQKQNWKQELLIICKNFCWNSEQDLHILDVKYVSHSTKNISGWIWFFIIVY